MNAMAIEVMEAEVKVLDLLQDNDLVAVLELDGSYTIAKCRNIDSGTSLKGRDAVEFIHDSKSPVI